MSKIESITTHVVQLVFVIVAAWGSSFVAAVEQSESVVPVSISENIVKKSEQSPIIEQDLNLKQGLSLKQNDNSVSGITPSPGVSSGAWIDAILGLIAVVSLIFFVAWFVKRFTGLAVSNQQQMRILSAIPVGTRERIALVEVADKQLLVGITQHNINLLHSFDEPVVNKNDKTGPDFASRLQSILSKGVAGTNDAKKTNNSE